MELTTEKKELILWEEGNNFYLISGAKLIDLKSKKNDFINSNKSFGYYKGSKDKMIYWTKVNIDNLPETYKEQFI